MAESNDGNIALSALHPAGAACEYKITKCALVFSLSKNLPAEREDKGAKTNEKTTSAVKPRSLGHS